jgi:hypothetical protein
VGQEGVEVLAKFGNGHPLTQAFGPLAAKAAARSSGMNGHRPGTRANTDPRFCRASTSQVEKCRLTGAKALGAQLGDA